MSVNLDELKQLAQAVIERKVPLSEANLEASLDYMGAIREFEKAVNPQTVLDLIEQVEEQQRHIGLKDDSLTSYAEAYERIAGAMGFQDFLPGDAADNAMIERIHRLTEQVERLTAENETYRQTLVQYANRENWYERIDRHEPANVWNANEPGYTLAQIALEGGAE